MKLAIITLTSGDRTTYLADCLNSVRAGMPGGSTHQVTVCRGGDFQRTRWGTTFNAPAEYVAWVDDDDLVTRDALSRCIKALDDTGAGLAFTDEGRIDSIGKEFGNIKARKVTSRDLAMHPRTAHHLAVVRRSCLAPVVLEKAQSIGIGIDWLMRAYAGLVHGAVHVPMVGYLWRDHAGQESKTQAWDRKYLEAMPALRELTRRWMGPLDEPIPQHGA